MIFNRAIKNLLFMIYQAFFGCLDIKDTSLKLLIPDLTWKDISWIWVYNHEQSKQSYPWKEELFSAFYVQHLYDTEHRKRSIIRNKNFLGSWSSDGPNVWLTEYWYYDLIPDELTFNQITAEIPRLGYDFLVPYGKVVITADNGARRTDFAMTFGACGLASPRAELMFKFSNQLRWIVFGQPTPMGTFYLVFDNIEVDDTGNPHPMMGICHCQNDDVANLLSVLI